MGKVVINMKKMLYPLICLLAALMLFISMKPCTVYAGEPDENTRWLPADPVDVTTYEQMKDALSHNEEEPDENNIVWIDVARLAADITIVDGQKIESRGFLRIPSGRTLTIEDGGLVEVSFQIEQGGKVIVKSGGRLYTTMGDDCVNHGQLIVEPEAVIQSQMGASIVNAADGYMQLDGVFFCNGYKEPNGTRHMWIGNEGSLEGEGFVVIGDIFYHEDGGSFEDSLAALDQVLSVVGEEANDVRVLAKVHSYEEMEQLAGPAHKKGAYLDADITVSDGPEFDTRGTLYIPAGRRLTVAEGGDCTASFYIANGGAVIVETDATLATTQGFDCHNRGDLTVEPGGNLVSRFGTAIFNDDVGKLTMNGLFSVGSYQDPDGVNHVWYGNSGSVEGDGFIVTGTVAMASEEGSLAARQDVASQIKASLNADSKIRVLVSVFDSAEMKQLSTKPEIDGFRLTLQKPFDDEPEEEPEPQFFVIEDSMDTTGKVVLNLDESVYINSDVSFTTDCFISTSDVLTEDCELTVNGLFVAYKVSIGGTLSIGDDADIQVALLQFFWPSKPCKVRNVTGEIVYGAMYDLNNGSGPVSMNESENGKFYVPANPTRDGYTFKGWTISSKWKGSSVWMSAMDAKLKSLSVKKDSVGSYVDDPGMFPLTITAEWTLPLTPTPTPTPAAGFSDVQNPKHAYYNAIYWAADAGITKGYPDGTFGIDRACTRGEMMMFLWRYAGKKEPKAVSKSPFKDVPKTHTFYKAILWGSQKGITKGYSDGTFGVNRNVTRGECMMFLWRLKGKPAPKAVAKAPFPDVPKNHVFYNAVLWGFQKKITTGFKDGELKGKFGVDANCSRGQIVTFLYRAR